MVLPLYDHNPFKLPVKPVVTWLIIGVNFAVFLFQLSLGDDADRALIAGFGAVPAYIVNPLSDPGPVPAYATLFTCMWLHENWEHILGNMIFLFVFGDDIEEALGRWRFIVFYIACGLLASIAFVAFNPGSRLPLIGASGAIAGVLSAYLLIRPCARIVVALFVRFLIVPVPAWLAIGIWALLQVDHRGGKEDDGIAYMAHIGGLIAGIVLLLILRPRNVRLLQCIWDPEKVPDPAHPG